MAAIPSLKWSRRKLLLQSPLPQWASALAAVGKMAEVYRPRSANFKKNPPDFAIFVAMLPRGTAWEDE
jgi:hypothetical protein